MASKSSKVTGPPPVEVVINTTEDFDLNDPDDKGDLLGEIWSAIETDLRDAFNSAGTLRIRGSKKNC